jgi:hypothetical protein
MAPKTTLSDLVKNKLAEDRSGVVGAPYYNPLGDFVAVHLRDKPFYSERIDDLLTVYKSCDSGELIGCKIKGVSLLAKNIKHMFHITDCGDVQMRLLLFGAMGARQQNYYYELNDLVGDIKLPANQLLKPAA